MYPEKKEGEATQENEEIAHSFSEPLMFILGMGGKRGILPFCDLVNCKE